MILPAACTYIATNLMIILARSQLPEARSQSLATNARMILPAACTYIATNDFTCGITHIATNTKC
jgi:hypothetical protein